MKTTHRTTTVELADEAKRLAQQATILRQRVEAHVDTIAATGARTAALALLDLVDVLEDPELEVRR